MKKGKKKRSSERSEQQSKEKQNKEVMKQWSNEVRNKAQECKKTIMGYSRTWNFFLHTIVE